MVLGLLKEEEKEEEGVEPTGSTAFCRKTLQRIMNAASKIIGAPLPSVMDFYPRRATRTPSTPHAPSSATCPWGEGTGVSGPRPPDSWTSLNPGLSGGWTVSTNSPSLPPYTHPIYCNQHKTTQKEKLVFYLHLLPLTLNSQCWSWTLC